MGPVQENDTTTSVKAIKKMPRKLVVLAFASLLFVQLDGSVISNAPRNEKPNTKKSAKNTRLAIQFVARLFKAAGPKIRVTKKPSNVKITTIDAA